MKKLVAGAMRDGALGLSTSRIAWSRL
jgi:N-acyl-D-aspartate/D-glutamate deacylase